MKQLQLAINGGKPVRDSYLPYGKQLIDATDIEAVGDVLKSDYLTTGPMIETFEGKIANYVGTKYAVAFSSGTAALHAACYAAGIKQNDQVITTPMSFAATANAILYQGGDVVFADIDPQNGLITPATIEEWITVNTKAIITVDYTGQPVDYQAIREIANKNGITFISDAAHGLGAAYKGTKVGSLADMTMFSFHPVKHITAGEGGMITTNSKNYYEKLITFRNHGIIRDREKLNHQDQPWYYEMQSLGYNYRMTDIQAALGSNQADRIDTFKAKRKMIAEKYTNAFCDMDLLETPVQIYQTESSWHLYIIRLRLEKLRADRKQIFHALRKENIGVNVHYIPIYLHPFYQEKGYPKGLCPNAEQLYEEMITLPLFPQMTEEDAEDVIKAVKKVLMFYGVKS